ncbi:matrin-3-like isoform X1 [Pimephales promelas]|uniref:matrin-3-like isoform X1 n=2 Tax=Pimephales promelas TaxID=90988 RepID=UPI001955F192|nr:matrin-3-like isoform X1 [Pimephales promelas]
MSQKRTGSNAQKGFAVGRGLLAGSETLNFSMGETHSDPYSSSSRARSRSGLVGGEGKDHDSPLYRRAGSNINTVQLFASLGLSSTDLDVLAQVPEENLCMETLPHLLMLLKNRKMEASWGDIPGGRLDLSSGQAQSRSQGDFGYSSMQETSGRGYDMLDYTSGSGRDGQYSELSCDSYRNLGMSASSPSDDMFMQRRMGSPSQRKVQDFLGVMPLMFPHLCSLCDFEVLSVMEWTQHTTGIRHSENQKLLLQMYPDWDPQMPSNRTSTSLSLDTKSRSDRLLGADSIGGGLQRTGMSSSWGSESSLGMTSKMTSYSTAPKIKSRVVVLKYERKPKSTNSLFDLAKPFGTISKHLVLKNVNKAFLELQTHEEALAMANYYKRKPAILHGKEMQVYLSKELIGIKKSERPVRETRTREKKDVSQVVFFYHLPRESDKKMELLKIARRFGTVEKHLFVDKGAYVQMGNSKDAEMLVKYYTVNPLTISGRSIRLNICTKYKTLTDPPGKDDHGREEPARKRSGSSSATSRTADKHSSKNRRSSTSKAKERSDKKEEEPKPKEVEALGDGEGAEDEVMEACDEDQDRCDEDPSADDVDLSCDPEQTSEQAPDIDDANKEDETSDETTENQKDSGEKQEETPLEEPTISEAEQENTDELPKDLEEQNGDQTEDEGAEEDNEEQEGQTETDFPENMDEFVTLDELVEEENTKRKDSKSKAEYTSGSSKDSGGYRVINVIGFKRGHDYKDEILALAKPFGKVVRHLILDVRPEAFLQFSKEKEAKAMVSFYSRNALPSVCGRPVRVYHSHTYTTIQSGKVIYVGNIPPFKGSDALLLKIAEPFGKIRRYYMNRLRNECFIEMDRGEDAEKMAETYKEKRPKFEGKRLVVYVSRKFKTLKCGKRPPSPEAEDKQTLKRERSEDDEAQRNSSGKSKDKKEEEPSVKKIKVDEPVADKAKEMESHEEKESQNVSEEITPEEKKESEEKQCEDASELQNMETEPEAEDEETVASEKSVKTEEKTITTAPSEIKPETSHSTLEPYDPNVPVGVEFVKMGYYCRICFLFYSNEDTAKKIHCSSQAHYDKLKKYLEKEKAKAQSNGTKK